MFNSIGNSTQISQNLFGKKNLIFLFDFYLTQLQQTRGVIFFFSKLSDVPTCLPIRMFI